MKCLWWGIRIFIFYLALIPTTIIISTFGWLCAPLPSLWCYKIITSWSHFFIWWSKTILGLKYNVVGSENIPDKPCVILCNHQSTWETIFMQVLLPPQSWVLKRELLFIPFFGWGLALIKPIAIDRANRLGVKKTLELGKNRLNDGRYVVFYPEGTRLLPKMQKNYSRTGAALAMNAKVPVLPIAHNAGNFWPKGIFPKQSGTITIKIGNLIDTSNIDATKITDGAKAWIDNTKARMNPAG